MTRLNDLILTLSPLIMTAQLFQMTSCWSWTCVSQQCVRSEEPEPDSLSGSFEACRLTCGPFGAIWPQPTGTTLISDKILPIGLDFNWNTTGVKDIDRLAAVSEFVQSSKKILREELSVMCIDTCGKSYDGIQVNVDLSSTSSDLTLNWVTDERYSLEINPSDDKISIEVRAVTVYGLRHALETLSQLITFVRATCQLVIVTHAKVVDKPVYPHRGLLVDSARNFLPVPALLRTIDAMAAVKLNVLHWHATDTHSFPLLLPSVPQMARCGAGWQWGGAAGLGELAVCVGRRPWRGACVQPPCGQLNPANPRVYGVLGDVFADLAAALPPGEAIHMGGDEVFLPCWNSSTEITNWMKSRGMGLNTSDFLRVWAEFHQEALRVWDNATGNSKSPVLLWTSGLTRAENVTELLDKNRFVIEAWTNSNDTLAQDLLDKGYRVIMATKDAWYFDHGFWGTTQYHNWRQAYDNRLPSHPGVLGGEAAVWGELVDDANLDGRAWPRAAAVAERLWSDPPGDRLDEQRRRLAARGVRAEPVMPQWCALNEGGCDGSVNNS